MSDRLDLIGITSRGFHGVLPHERRDGQTFLVDVLLHVDTRAAAASDELSDTVDYASVAADVVALIEGPPQRLIETLAERIATACLAYPAVERVGVVVHKPEAPVGVPLHDVAVRITRP